MVKKKLNENSFRKVNKKSNILSNKKSQSKKNFDKSQRKEQEFNEILRKSKISNRIKNKIQVHALESSNRQSGTVSNKRSIPVDYNFTELDECLLELRKSIVENVQKQLFDELMCYKSYLDFLLNNIQKIYKDCIDLMNAIYSQPINNSSTSSN